jgi:hypothetical protein
MIEPCCFWYGERPAETHVQKHTSVSCRVMLCAASRLFQTEGDHKMKPLTLHLQTMSPKQTLFFRKLSASGISL